MSTNNFGLKITMEQFGCYRVPTTLEFKEPAVILVEGKSGVGKCLAKGTQILKSDGTLCAVEEVKIGDTLMGDDSKPRLIRSLTKGIDEMYKIVLKHGQSYTVNSHHILTLASSAVPIINYDMINKQWIVEWNDRGIRKREYFDEEYKAKELFTQLEYLNTFDVPLDDYLSFPQEKKDQLYTYHTRVDFPSSNDHFLIDPYLLGYWLGCGNLTHKTISVSEPAILEYLNEQLVKFKCVLQQGENNIYNIINSSESTTNLFIQALETLELTNWTSIPLNYKTGSFSMRMSILAGLIDSKGIKIHDTDNNEDSVIIKCNGPEIFIKDIEFLTFSLGLMVVKYTQHEQYISEHKFAFNIKNFTIKIFGRGLELIPTLSSNMKFATWNNLIPATFQKFEVVPIGKGEYFGFELDGNGRFLLEDFIVTHNSTILNAIHFALYGKPKLVSWGERSCRVIIEFPDMIITRIGSKADKTIKTAEESSVASTKLKIPNRNSLVIESGSDIFKEGEAQALIDQRFGTNFTITSYITQKDVASFFGLGPSDRIEFLERIAFGDIDIKGMKKRLGTIISKQKKALDEKVGELRFTRDEAAKYPEPVFVKCPLDKPWTEIRAKNERTRQKKVGKALKTALEELSELTNKRTSALHIREKISELKIQKKELTKTFKNLESQLEDLPLRDTKLIESRITFLRVNKELVKLRNFYLQEEAQYKADQVSDRYQLQCDLDERLTRTIVVDKTVEIKSQIKLKERISALQKHIKTNTEALLELDNAETYNSAISELNDLEAELITRRIKVQESATVKQCPKCSTSLRLIDSNLIIYNGEIIDKDGKSVKALNKELEMIRKDRSDYEESLHEVKRLNNEREINDKELRELSTIDMNIDYEALLIKHTEELHEYKINQDRIRELRYKLEHNIFDSRTLARGRIVEETARKIKQLETSLGPDLGSSLSDANNIDILTSQLNSVKLDNQKRQFLLDKFTETKKTTDEVENKLGKLQLDDIDYDELIDTKNSEIKSLKNEEKLLNEKVISLNIYENYMKERVIWEDWQTRKLAAEDDEINFRKILSVSEKMLRKIQENEGVSVLNTIDQINTHLNYYAERFFTDPINVEISAFKESKTGEKLNVNIKVFYKGINVKITELSGGEQARLELAICLAINAMGSGSLLLLDECLSSLDAETTEDIVELLKTHAQETGKMIITVCHQVSTGMFDQVIQL